VAERTQIPGPVLRSIPPLVEPSDRLSIADRAELWKAAALLYDDMSGTGASARELNRIADIAARVTDVRVQWVAEEVTE
jgi:hypothetical protein